MYYLCKKLMMKKKISFSTVNKNNYTIINKKDINGSRIRIAEEMKKFKRKLIKHENYN